MSTLRNAKIERALSDHAYYVLITCDPSKDGIMPVNFFYRAPPWVASYLLHGAQDFLEEKILDDEKE